ncbi:MAG: DUF1583 domain-containing protein [Deltaproteobacteria bacterium]|nr:DUF1583 domain-containing protein [Deltaproteobacteria bacterium]
MKNIVLTMTLGFWLIFSAFPLNCPAQTSLPADLSRYQDTFERFRHDLWETIGFIPGQEKRQAHFKLADVRTEKGRLRVETKTGNFSLGGLGSKFSIRGDFDIQIDCAVELKNDLSDMEQLALFHVLDKTKELQDQEVESVNIVIFKPAVREPSRAPMRQASKPPVRNAVFLFTGYTEKGKYSIGSRKETDGFKGSLRITREGNRITTLYKKEDEPDWQKMHSFSRPASDVVVGFKAQNFGRERTTIGASAPFVTFFDNFKVNSAQEIIESEI